MIKKNNKNLKQLFEVILIGISSGFVCGFFSTGGGLLLVPTFSYILKMDSKKARGTTIFCILPIALTSSIFYYKKSYINVELAFLCGIGGAIGRIFRSKIIKKNVNKIFKNNIYNFFNICFNKTIFIKGEK